MADQYLQTTGRNLVRFLHEQVPGHLHVRVYVKHVIIHSGAPGDGDSRARLTQVASQNFRGPPRPWEQTPFLGTWRDRLTHRIDDFGSTLISLESDCPA